MASSYANLHPVDQILTSLVQEAVPSDDQLIADKVLETIKVPERSGTLLVENTRNFMEQVQALTSRELLAQVVLLLVALTVQAKPSKPRFIQQAIQSQWKISLTANILAVKKHVLPRRLLE